MKPYISIIIPAYNYAHFLVYTLENVLSQVDIELDIVVVDDGSTDNTADVVKRFGGAVRYIYQENKGLSAARNTGMLHAQGDFLVFLDADDLLLPGTLQAQASRLIDNTEAQIAICYNQLFSSDTPQGPFHDLGRFEIIKQDFFVWLCKHNIAPVHAHMIRRKAALQVGNFDTSLKSLEDYDFWLRCAAAGHRFTFAENGIALYRKHDASMSSSLAEMHRYECMMRSKVHFLLQQCKCYSADEMGAAWMAHSNRCLMIAELFWGTNDELATNLSNLAFVGMGNVEKIFANSAPNDDWAKIYIGLILLQQLERVSAKNPDKAAWAQQILFRFFPLFKASEERKFRLLSKAYDNVISLPLYVTNFTTWETAFRANR